MSMIISVESIFRTMIVDVVRRDYSYWSCVLKLYSGFILENLARNLFICFPDSIYKSGIESEVRRKKNLSFARRHTHIHINTPLGTTVVGCADIYLRILTHTRTQTKRCLLYNFGCCSVRILSVFHLAATLQTLHISFVSVFVLLPSLKFIFLIWINRKIVGQCVTQNCVGLNACGHVQNAVYTLWLK